MSQRSASNPRYTSNEKTGAMKRSVARAKPKTAAASTVRIAESNAKTGGRAMTGDERKRAEQEERNSRNRNLAATNVLLKKDPKYARNRILWGVFLVSGLAFTILSWVILLFANEDARDMSSVLGRISVGCLVLAYILVIGSFIFDFTLMRKQRKAMEEKVAAMSDKRVQEILRDEAFERAERKKLGFFGRFRRSAPAQEEASEETSAE